MARPTDYSPAIIKKAEEYLKKLPKDEVIHSIEGLADYIGIARSTVYKWADEAGKEKFSDIVESVLAKQAKKLANEGLKGKFQPTITKVMLTKHGYREGHEHTGPDGGSLFTNEHKEKSDQAISQLIEGDTE